MLGRVNLIQSTSKETDNGPVSIQNHSRRNEIFVWGKRITSDRVFGIRQHHTVGTKVAHSVSIGLPIVSVAIAIENSPTLKCAVVKVEIKALRHASKR